MKNKLYLKLSLFVGMLFGLSAISSANPVERIEGYIFPEVDFKYVEFLTHGHLHKNKPRYGKYNWKVLESPHFQIYTYGNDDRLANLYLKDAEAIYAEFSAEMNMNHFTEKIRVIIFNSSRDFEEANMMFGLIPKGLGGVTEMIKWKRVVVAFRDSPTGFRRLLRHELVHRYQGEFLKITLMNFMKRDVPLWFMEGSAEHLAHPWDARGEFVMRDAYLNNYLARVDRPSAWYTSLVYKQGEFILHFLANEYKSKGNVIGKILKNSAEMSFEEAFQKATGDSLETFNKKLWRQIEIRYSPLRAKTDIADEAKSIGEGTILAAKGRLFITRRTVYGRETLFLNWTDGAETKSKKLVDGGRLKSIDIRGFEVEISPEFGFQEHGASFASSTTLVYSMDVGGEDALIVQHFTFDEKNKKKFRLKKKSKYKFEGVREIQYPVLLNGKEAAFVGRRDGVFAELFVANLASRTVTQITDTQRTYRGITYCQSQNALVTSVENEATQSYDLAIYNLKTKKFSFLTNTPENEFGAVCSPEGSELLYVSDRGLVHNIHRYNLAKNTDETLTDAKIGAFRPHWFGENGVAFNWISRGEIAVKAAPLPVAAKSAALEISTGAALSIWDNPKVKKLRSKIPGVESMTIFDVALSSDQTKAIFAENRKLSMEVLEWKDPEMRFHVVSESTDAVVTFTLKEFKKMKHYGAIGFLSGTNVLIQKKIVMREAVSNITDERNRNIEEEVTYKESYIYDWEKRELHDMDTEITSDSNGSNRSHSLMSPDRRYVAWTDSDKRRIFVYDIATKEKKKLDKKFYEIQQITFISDARLLVLDKEWDYSLIAVDVSSDAYQTWDKLITEKVKFEKEVSWFPVENGKKVFFVVPKEKYGLDVLLFDMDKSTINLIATEVPLVKKAEVKDDSLRLTIANDYGLDRVMAISGSGEINVADEPFKYSVTHASRTVKSLNLNVLPRDWNVNTNIPTRTRKMFRVPRPLHAYGVAGVSAGSGGVGAFLALQMVAFDEINNKALATDIYIQNGTQGLANIEYYNFENGRSYLLDYWNFDGRRQKLDAGVRQNIFLHEFMNWDITFKQQQVKNPRTSGTVEWWRSNLGTTFSIDTLVWDCQASYWMCHGPHSGAAFFSGTEVNVDNKKGFQSADLNLEARYHIPFSERTGLALRALGGRSFGPTPSVFVWGGNGTFRGIPLFSQAGNAYAMQSTELRVPILNAVGAVFSGPIGEGFAPLTVFMDVRGGVYHDIGDIWYLKNPLFDGHQKFQLQQSAGYFVNVPTIFGLNARFNKGFYGKQDWNFWLGYNW